jgi:PAS domain S-box-containing protein
MQDTRTRSLKVLARVLAAISGLIAIFVFGAYAVAPTTLSDAGISLTAAILGVLAVIYFLTLHQVLSKTRASLSTLILTIITASNVMLLIMSTGGLNSPFYSLWLLAIVVAGVFGTPEVLAILGLTLVYYVYALISEGLHAPFISEHLVQLVITLVAGGLAEWMLNRNQKASETNTQLASMSGKLSTEQLKADAIVSSIGEGVMVIDAARKIQLFNKAAQELTGWDEPSAKNIDYNLVLQLKTSDDKPLSDSSEPFAEAWKSTKTTVKDNLVMTSRAGRKIQLSLSISPLYDSAKLPSGAIALFRDISKEKEMERQKDEFVSTASHEMRTPVAAIEGYISLAMNPNVATIDERAKKYLDKAHEAIGHLGELFRDLLSVTKADAENLEIKIEPVNLAKLLQSTTDDMQFVAKKKNITLVYQIGSQSGKAIAPLFYIAANGERMREVVMNLIDNAIKFTSQGGVKVTLEGNDKEVTVAIQDTGVGIAQEDIPHLFQKFYRVDSSATRTIGGTGLGLYLCRRLIEHFNGRVWVESKPNLGSTFKFSLPRLSQEEVDKMEREAQTNDATAAAGKVVKPNSGQDADDSPAAVPPAPSTTLLPTAVPTTPPEAAAAAAGPRAAVIATPVPGE